MITLTHEDRADLLRWVVSGAIILAAHGAIATSLLQRTPPEDESVYGATTIVMIELQPEPPIEQPEQKVEEKVEEPPTDVAMLPEPKQEVPKPVEEQPPPPPPPTAAKTEGRQDATTGANPLPAWQKEVNKLLEKNKRYPSQVHAQRQRMVTRVAVNMDREGKVMSTRIATSSGLSAFDQTALEIIERAQPFPPPPAVLQGAEVLVIMPIWFDPRR